MIAAANGTYTRSPEGTWVYPWGDPVPDAGDMTLSNLYNLPVITDGIGRQSVSVDRALAHGQPDLAWCLDYDVDPGPAPPDPDAVPVVLSVERSRMLMASLPIHVPLEEWERHAAEPIGMWAPELVADRMLDTDAVARLAGVEVRTVSKYLANGRMPQPQARLGGSPAWALPIIRRWLAHRPGRGAGGGRPRKPRP